MAHPVVWPKKTFFYPIGNTPPVCFTQDLSPDKGAQVLLLGCGDPRSILYTVHADIACYGRDMDFTCCDWEPAILARNIILLTMISDGVQPTDAWPIFFHFFLDEKSHSLLRAQCRTLIQSSPTMKTWQESKYGSFLRFCTESSMVEIRRHWIQYLELEDLTPAVKRGLKEEFTNGMKLVCKTHGQTNISSIRSAGPLLPSIIQNASKSYEFFWTNGISPSNLPRNAPTPHLNPTFVYTLAGRSFNVHYGTNPILAFHLAPILATKKDATTIEDLGDGARSQFSVWCTSFKKRLFSKAQGNIVIRFFVGESLAFGQALRNVQETGLTHTGIYAHPWGASQIIFDASDYGSSKIPAPLSFNIIETSNLADHTGLLNLLAVALPLLRREPWSIIHTNTLLRKDSSAPATSGLSAAACADISTLSILLGITPSSHMWHFTTHSNKHEIIVSSMMSGQLHETISWRFVSNFIPNSVSKQENSNREQFCIACDSKKLAQFLFSVYMQMFAEEDQFKNLQNLGNLSVVNKMSVVHYVRASFAAFLASIKENVSVNWSDTMDQLIDLIAKNRTFLMGSNNYQDLMCYLVLQNVHTLPVLTSVYLESVRTPRDRFYGWENVPPVVCIVLKVPRKQLKPLEDMDADEIKTPILQCESSSANFHNIHSSIQLCFGDIVVSSVDGEPQVVINEDQKGWSGNSALIVTFYLPAWILTISPATTQIGLHIRNTPASMMVLLKKLDMRLTIYSTSLTDTKNVQIVRHRPGNAHEVEHLRGGNPRGTVSSQNKQLAAIAFDSSCRKATSLTIRKDIKDPQVAQALRSGSKVLTKPIGDSAFLATLNNNVYPFIFPCAIYTHRSKTRIARASSYLEIEAPVRSDFSDFLDLSLNPFAIALGDQQPNLLNIHYVNLDTLPAVHLPAPPKQLDWLSMHAAMMYSETEKKARENPDQMKRGVLVNLKESIACILLKYAGLQLESPRDWSSVFGLCDPGNGGVYNLIFVNAMKFDLPNHTVVVDACLVPLVNGIMPKLLPGLQAITKSGLLKIVTLEDEVRAWKLLLPALAERCRTWEHTDACEYRKQGIPVALEGSEVSPLCSCGKGKNLGAFGTVPEWEAFRGEATRVAIGPLFSFSFLEKSIKSMKNAMDNNGSNLSSSSSPSLEPSLQCAKCGGPGKPSLRLCSVCKKIQYCSRECQKAHWKVHKKSCTTTS